MQSRYSRLFYSWTSKTNSVQSYSGYETSRREQARLHEDLTQRERALREAYFRSIHEVEELKKSSGNVKRRILQTSIERKSSYCTRAHITNTGIGRKSESYERLCGIPRRRISPKWKIIPRSQTTGSGSKSSWTAEPRPKPATWYMELTWYMEKRFWQSTCINRFIIDIL